VLHAGSDIDLETLPHDLPSGRTSLNQLPFKKTGRHGIGSLTDSRASSPPGPLVRRLSREEL
jgi:hypothetical protein